MSPRSIIIPLSSLYPLGEELYCLARERVEEKNGFDTHFTAYIGVDILLVIIWAVTGAGFPWFVFPLGGWGIGILFYFLGFLLSHEQGTRKKSDRKIDKEVEGLEKGGNWHVFSSWVKRVSGEEGNPSEPVMYDRKICRLVLDELASLDSVLLPG